MRERRARERTPPGPEEGLGGGAGGRGRRHARGSALGASLRLHRGGRTFGAVHTRSDAWGTHPRSCDRADPPAPWSAEKDGRGLTPDPHDGCSWRGRTARASGLRPCSRRPVFPGRLAAERVPVAGRQRSGREPPGRFPPRGGAFSAPDRLRRSGDPPTLGPRSTADPRSRHGPLQRRELGARQRKSCIVRDGIRLRSSTRRPGSSAKAGPLRLAGKGSRRAPPIFDTRPRSRRGRPGKRARRPTVKRARVGHGLSARARGSAGRKGRDPWPANPSPGRAASGGERRPRERAAPAAGRARRPGRSVPRASGRKGGAGAGPSGPIRPRKPAVLAPGRAASLACHPPVRSLDRTRAGRTAADPLGRTPARACDRAGR